MDAEFPKSCAFNNTFMNMVDSCCEAQEEINNAKNVIANLTRELNTQKEWVSRVTQENNGLKKELNETTLRLNTIMGMKITNVNPDIADLSDENRPTTLLAMFSELYDNEWTDAFVLLTKQMSETEAIKWLLVILSETKQYCDAQQQAKCDEAMRTLLVNEGDTIPDFVVKFVKENRKKKAISLLETECKEYMVTLSPSTFEWRHIALHLSAYTQECFRVCYLISIQDQPVVFDTLDIKHGDILDTNYYKAYTKVGEKVDFMVWPCLRLCKEGRILSKGVVQCIPSLEKATNVSASVREGPEIFASGEGRNKQMKQNDDADFFNQQGAIGNDSDCVQVESEMEVAKYDVENNKISIPKDESSIEHGPDDNIRTYNQMSLHNSMEKDNVDHLSSASAESVEKTAHVDGKNNTEFKCESVEENVNHRSFEKQMKHKEDTALLYQQGVSEKEIDHTDFESKMEFPQSDKETRPSLSEIIGMKITNDIPGIAEANHQANIARMYCELYDNQWTDAFETLKRQMSETDIIKWLLNILEATHHYCVNKEHQWVENLQRTLYVNKDETVPDFVMKFIKEKRKTKTDSLLETEYQEFSKMLQMDTSKEANIALTIPDYTKKCFNVCYLMSIQDPPVVLDTTHGDMLDTKKYKEYTKKGEEIDFKVWPCLLLCKGGAVLCKGTVQCVPSTKCSVNAKHAPLDRSKQSTLVEKQDTQRQQKQDEARVSQKTGGIEGSHVNQSEKDVGHVVAMGNGSDSQGVAKLPAENQPSGFSVNTDVKQDHQSSAFKDSQIDGGNPSWLPRNDKVEEVAGAKDATTATINASNIQKYANSSEEYHLNSRDGNENVMQGEPSSKSDDQYAKQEMDTE